MTNAHEKSQHGHVFRPGPFRRRRAYWLDGGVLHWRIGDSPGHVPLTDIASMRLHVPEGGTKNIGALAARCVLVEKSGRVHKLCDRYWPRWTKEERRYWGRLQRRNATFRGLTFTLARRLAKANPEAVFNTGPSRIEWIATSAVAALAVTVVIGGSVLMLAQGKLHYHIAGFMALALAYLPMLWPVIRSGGPKPFDPAILHNANPPPDRVDW